MDFKLPHGIVCTYAKRDEPPQPLDSFTVGFSFCKTSLPELVGPAARLF
ncbi:MAG: hypothetical protein J6X49_02530 [Victivallales bacterium]|nr:hypothetical protein [Victivallales bacterium]